MCNLVTLDISLVEGAQPVKRQRMKKAVEYLMDNNILEQSDIPWASPCLLIPKADVTDHFCTNYRPVDRLTPDDGVYDDIIDTIVSKIDLLRGYY